jgi:ketosteroid isomerase-like protein
MKEIVISTAERNAELVRKGYEAFNSGDVETLSELFRKDAIWTTPGKSSVAGTRNGQDSIFSHFGRYAAESKGTFKSSLKEICTNEEGNVVGIHHSTGTRNGKKLDTDVCIVFKLDENGQLISGTEFFFDLNNWEDYWS